MKVPVNDFLDAFTRADQHIAKICPTFHKICSYDMRRDIPENVYVKMVSAFWEEYHGCRISSDGMNTYVHFRQRADLTAFLLKWA